LLENEFRISKIAAGATLKKITKLCFDLKCKKSQ
jgi:hypothetical protein